MSQYMLQRVATKTTSHIATHGAHIAYHLIPTITRLTSHHTSRAHSTLTHRHLTRSLSSTYYLQQRYYSRTRVPEAVEIGKASASVSSAKIRFNFTKSALAAQSLDPTIGRSSTTAVAPITTLHIHAIPVEWTDYVNHEKPATLVEPTPCPPDTDDAQHTTSGEAVIPEKSSTSSKQIVKIAPPLPPSTSISVPIQSITRLDKPAPIVVPGLTNGVAYHFTIEAENEVGVSPTSYASNEVTPDVLWSRIKRTTKHELKHYWHGSKLLWVDMKIAFRLVKRILRGDTLSRRDRRTLLRTTADMFRLVPFAVIVIVPFMEFALPVLLKLFPNMLPSTFTDAHDQAAKHRKQLAVKVEMAQFLQETTQLMAQKLLAQKQESQSGQRLSLAEFTDFMNKVRSGQSVKNEEILKYSSLFSEEFTLENLSRAQLVAMCKLLDIHVFGSDGVLRYKLSRRLDELYKDDQMIAEEGVDSLESHELIEACRARGIYDNSSEPYLRRKLSDWIELSLQSEIPTSLLVLSRAFSAKYQPFHPEIELQHALKHLPEAVVEDTAQNILDQTPLDNDEHLAIQLEALKSTSFDDTTHPIEVTPRSDVPQGITTTTIVPKKLTTIPEVAPTLLNMKEMIAELKDENKEVAEDFDEVVEQAKSDKETPQAAPTPTPIRPPRTVTVTLSSGSVTKTAKLSVPLDLKEQARADALNDQIADLLSRLEQQITSVEQQAPEAPPAVVAETTEKPKITSNTNKA